MITETVDPDWLRSMYQLECQRFDAADRHLRMRNSIKSAYIIRKRPRVELPAPERVYAEIAGLADAVTTIDNTNQTIQE